MIPTMADDQPDDKSVPRACGDDPHADVMPAVDSEVFPAHAGMIPRRRHEPLLDGSVPRACGDDPIRHYLHLHSGQCSPRMRG